MDFLPAVYIVLSKHIYFFVALNTNFKICFFFFREIALTTILLKAGLGLDAGALKKLSFVVARLAFTPCFTEATGAAVAAHFLLDMPWLWGFLLG